MSMIKESEYNSKDMNNNSKEVSESRLAASRNLNGLKNAGSHYSTILVFQYQSFNCLQFRHVNTYLLISL